MSTSSVLRRLYPPPPEPLRPASSLLDWLHATEPVDPPTLDIHHVGELLARVWERRRPSNVIYVSEHTITCWHITVRYFRRKAQQKATKQRRRAIGRSRW